MSAETIARWNAISLVRKRSRSRSRSDKEDDPDDDISIVSRSPSPMPLDRDETQEYDAFHKGPKRETVTVHTKIESSNIGHKLLSKMGWKEGEGLGLSGQGRVEPIPFVLKSDSTGIGKSAQDLRVLAVTATQRRDMDAERQSRETVEQRQQRENTVAKAAAIRSEIATTLRPFYCELCDKQYTTIAQYDEHIRSYAHTHKQRFKDMEAAQKPKDISKAREKERKREEKELKRLAAASGVKLAAIPKPVVPVTLASQPVDTTLADVPPNGGGGGWTSFKKNNSGGFRPAGWATVQGSSSGTPGTTGASGTTGTGGWARVTRSASSPDGQPMSAITAPSPGIVKDGLTDTPKPRGNPIFQSSGFTRLDTTTDIQSTLTISPPAWKSPTLTAEAPASRWSSLDAPPSHSIPLSQSSPEAERGVKGSSTSDASLPLLRSQISAPAHAPEPTMPSPPIPRLPPPSSPPPSHRPPSPPRSVPYNLGQRPRTLSPKEYDSSIMPHFDDSRSHPREQWHGDDDYHNNRPQRGYGPGYDRRDPYQERFSGDTYNRDDYGRRDNFERRDDNYRDGHADRFWDHRGRGYYGRRF
ncbi:uncharacterized protein EI90DRAFT_3159705 [Cantharellus anzutake]|uniref:uncharacterized protein n=1 Tax=Cantharellus anzutake TaxID=1750568 RepID=UPI00190644CE|nr:uncharacterized protein EI90DRAFT_3159705 [Cantharellus anzutake]KAF8313364.1 hypothetical protein EI90DRAFT_3159705 [Cantharellus anzutake]